MPRAIRKPGRPATIAQAAAYVPCGKRTIQRYIASGRLTAYRFGPKMVRVDLAEVDELFQRIPAGGGDEAA